MGINGKMHSRGGLEDFEVPGVQECSGTLLFVQVGHGVVTVDISGAREFFANIPFVGTRGFIIRCDRCFLFVINASQCLRKMGSRVPTPYVLVGWAVPLECGAN